MSSGRGKRSAVILLIAVLAVSGAVAWLSAQGTGVQSRPQPPGSAQPQKRERPFMVNVGLVLVNVSVVDSLNRIVTGLEKQHFRVFEEDKEQKILHFSTEDVPISLGVVFDCSGSMKGISDMAYRAALEFFKAANPQDEFMIVDFNSQPRLIADFTTSIAEIASKLLLVESRGTTALFDALYLAINRMKHARHERKAILIISDGGENHSRYTQAETAELVKESDVLIYGIGIYGTPGSREEVEGPYLMRLLAESSGGRAFSVGQANAPDVAAKIGTALRNDYVLAYRPANQARDGKWRKITVKLVPPRGLPPLRARAKPGYYAPTQ